jgi:transposase
MGVFLGVDWAEDHHDLCLVDADGRVLATRRIPEGIDGVGVLHALIGEHVEAPAEVSVGIETDRGLLVGSLVAAGYQVYAINPLAASRYRDRHATSRAKCDRGDAKMLADLVRTDRHNHRPVAADTELLEAIKALARSHQNLIWTRQRQTNQLRSTLREYYPGALAAFDDLAHPDALAVLAKAPTPELGRRLSTAQIRSALKAAGRQRNLDRRAQEIRDALREPQLEAAPLVADAYGTVVAALVPIIGNLAVQIDAVETKLIERFEQHPDAELLLRLPGLSFILAARVLTEFGDAPNRYADAKARRNYAGTAPITRASGTSEVVLARLARNRRLFDACYQWAFCALNASPGARAYYDAHNPGPRTGKTARRKLANKLVGILHGTITHRTDYDETLAWQHWLPDENQLAA